VVRCYVGSTGTPQKPDARNILLLRHLYLGHPDKLATVHIMDIGHSKIPQLMHVGQGTGCIDNMVKDAIQTYIPTTSIEMGASC
jgi:hypothetical protein